MVVGERWGINISLITFTASGWMEEAAITSKPFYLKKNNILIGSAGVFGHKHLSDHLHSQPVGGWRRQQSLAIHSKKKMVVGNVRA